MNDTMIRQPEPLLLIGYGVIIPVICFCGVICNVLNLIVMFDRRLSESCYTYLSCLAFADTCALILFGFNGIGRGHYPDSRGWRMFEAHVYMPVGFIATTASVVFTVSVTIERFIFLYYPYASKKWCTRHIARKVAVTVAVASFIYNIPRMLVFTVSAENKLSYTRFGKGLFYKVLSWFHLLVISLGACLMLIVFNILLITGVKRNKRRHNNLTSSTAKQRKNEHDQTRITWMLIAVIFVFITGELPSAMLSRALVVGIFSAGDTGILTEDWYKISVLIATILVTLQHSLNFLIYCLFHRKFCRIFKENVCYKKKSRVDDNQNSPIRKSRETLCATNNIEGVSLNTPRPQESNL